MLTDCQNEETVIWAMPSKTPTTVARIQQTQKAIIEQEELKMPGSHAHSQFLACLHLAEME